MAQFCTFFIDKYMFGLDVEHVQEVLKSKTKTTVPLSNDVVQGLINLRGQIVTSLDLAKQLGLPSTVDEKEMNLIIRDNNESVSLLVDDIGDVITADPKDSEKPPSSLSGRLGEYVVSVYKIQPNLLMVLDAKKLCKLD